MSTNLKNSGFNKVGIFNYSFNLDHDTMLIDRKNFIKTIHQGVGNKYPKPYIEIAVPTSINIISMYTTDDKVALGPSIEKIVFYYSHTVDGKFFYKEDTYVDGK